MADEKDLSKDTEEVTQESETVAPEKGAKTAKSDKDAKADAAKKKGPGLGKRIAKYFRDVKGEFKKIIWTDKKTLGKQTVAVVVISAIICALITLVDSVALQLVEFIIK